MPDYDLIAILGPTASGKTPFAAALAAELNTEIISADSRQIYRSMDIGTGKDLADYIVNGKQVPYHLIDIADPGYKYNVFEYQRDFLNAYESIKQKGSLPLYAAERECIWNPYSKDTSYCLYPRIRNYATVWRINHWMS